MTKMRLCRMAVNHVPMATLSRTQLTKGNWTQTIANTSCYSRSGVVSSPLRCPVQFENTIKKSVNYRYDASDQFAITRFVLHAEAASH